MSVCLSCPVCFFCWSFVEVMKLNLGQDSEARFGQDFEAYVLWRSWFLVVILKLMLARDSEDKIWSRYVFELVIWTQTRVRCAFGNVLIAWLVGCALIGKMVGQIQVGLVVTCRMVRVSGSLGWNADNLGNDVAVELIEEDCGKMVMDDTLWWCRWRW